MGEDVRCDAETRLRIGMGKADFRQRRRMTTNMSFSTGIRLKISRLHNHGQLCYKVVTPRPLVEKL